MHHPHHRRPSLENISKTKAPRFSPNLVLTSPSDNPKAVTVDGEVLVPRVAVSFPVSLPVPIAAVLAPPLHLPPPGPHRDSARCVARGVAWSSKRRSKGPKPVLQRLLPPRKSGVTKKQKKPSSIQRLDPTAFVRLKMNPLPSPTRSPLRILPPSTKYPPRTTLTWFIIGNKWNRPNKSYVAWTRPVNLYKPKNTTCPRESPPTAFVRRDVTIRATLSGPLYPFANSNARRPN
mmetsp:Transcript_18105/g.49378  ORF Transcript_18105/g.49378 Transcript_18105/m.49378 type:complete len:233 (+) Transcript_18105:150-848(+)